MSKLSLEQQIAQLTPEQKNNIPRIYKSFLMSYVIALLVGVVLTIGIFTYANSKAEQARAEDERIQAEIASNDFYHNYDFSLYDKSLDAIDEYYDMLNLRDFSFAIGSLTAVAGMGVIYFVYKIKYPYFSEKKYSYLKKMEKTKV